MLKYVCVRDVMDIVFSVCIVMRGVLCTCMGSMSVSSCRCMFVSCVHPVAVLNAEFCMTCNLLMLVKYEKGNHMDDDTPELVSLLPYR